MFARKYRLPISETRKKIVRTYSSAFFLLKIFDSPFPYNRFAVIIGKNAAKKSTDRHLWKRRILAIAGKLPNLRKDFLFIVSPRINAASFQELRVEIDKALAKIEN